MKTTIEANYHITGWHPCRLADAEDQQSNCHLVSFQRGFECLTIAVYGDRLSFEDCEEAAIEWLTKNNPDALTEDERNGESDSVAVRFIGADKA